ncbi:MAG TPA: hypothetical protein ENI20_01025 [Bacteroides sp.]|nr:hypothetical protein [Bacteroides sp.]
MRSELFLSESAVGLFAGYTVHVKRICNNQFCDETIANFYCFLKEDLYAFAIVGSGIQSLDIGIE